MKKNLKQLFCKHDYEWCRKVERYQILSGERQYLVCKKCGRVIDTIFIRY